MSWKSNHHPVTGCEEEDEALGHLTLTPMQHPNFIVFNTIRVLIPNLAQQIFFFENGGSYNLNQT